ncbi:MAG: hypothetical protein JEZ07_08200 [Phycisphaerae bacterium]|nr:hypothetical protein [Phycisphaerae bacterium]
MNRVNGKKVVELKRFKFICALAMLMAFAGCPKPQSNYRSPYYPRTWNVAIVPFINHSGSIAINPLALTDSFFTELQMADRVEVVAVNRVLAAMEHLKMNSIESPADVSLLAQELQVDAVIVGEVMGYDPYKPPRIELRLQIYEKPELNNQVPVGVNPGEIARAGTTFILTPGYQLSPSRQVSRIFDADRKDVIDKIKAYAKAYSDENDPAGWEAYLTSQKYLRFTSYVLVGDVLEEISAMHPN